MTEERDASPQVSLLSGLPFQDHLLRIALPAESPAS